MNTIVTSAEFARVLVKALGLPETALSCIGHIDIELPPTGIPKITMQWYVRDDLEADALAEACKDARITVEQIDYRSLLTTEAPTDKETVGY